MLRLDTFLGRIFEKIQRHRTLRSPQRSVAAFFGQHDDIALSQPAAMEVRSPPFPAYWADSEGTWTEASNAMWDEGQWSIPDSVGRWDDGVSKWDDGITKWG